MPMTMRIGFALKTELESCFDRKHKTSRVVQTRPLASCQVQRHIYKSIDLIEGVAVGEV
jgi:hypothetical protein